MGTKTRAMMLGVALCAGAATLALSQDRVSRPGAYAGYAQASYDGTERTSFYLPMRDGTKLAVDLFRPTKGGKVATERLPVVWMHTPYNRRTYSGGPAVERYPGYAAQLVRYGYNVAVVDFRGVYASGGRNVGYNRGEWVDAARYDAYDVTEWFARQPWSNGKIGMWGCSATGGSQMQAATTRPPSLRAIIPMSAEFDAYGAFAVGGVVTGGRVAPPGQSGANTASAARDRGAVAVDGPEGRTQLAQAVASHARNIESPGALANRDSRSETPEAGEWWMRSSPASYLAALKADDIGVMAVANWDEAGTRHGAFFTATNLPAARTKLLVGPGTHCAWSYVKEQTGFDLVTEELRFFDYWLKGVKNNVMTEPRVTYYTYNAPKETAWRSSPVWPLANERRTMFYLGQGRLSGAKPVGGGLDYVAMSPPPAGQSTTVAAPTGGLVYETEALTRDMQVTGHPVMQLWLSTDAGDVDVMARIEDVAPDGKTESYQMLGRMRASHRALATAPYNNLGLPWHSFRTADARPVPKGALVEVKFDLLPMSYIFKAGHKVRLTLTFADPERRTGPAPMVAVYRKEDRVTALILPVIPAGR